MKVTQLHDYAALPRGKGPRYPSDRKLSGPQIRFGRRGEEKNLLSARNLKPVAA